MLLGVKTKKQVALRHLLVGALSAGLVVLGWQVHAEWDPDMRLWKAFGVAAFLDRQHHAGCGMPPDRADRLAGVRFTHDQGAQNHTTTSRPS